MASKGFDVIVCGSLHLDIMLHAPSLPRPDETVTGTRWDRQCGGKGGNQAVMAARAGAKTAMIGRVGADDFGERLTQNLADSGVDVSEISVDPVAGSGMSAAIVRDDGEYGAVIVSGSNLRIDPAALVTSWRQLGGARAVILQNEVAEAVNVAVGRVARDSGALVILNAAPARLMAREMLDLVDVLIVNRVEAEMLSGRNVDSRDVAMAVMPNLRTLARAVVVTLGGDGVVLGMSEGDVRSIPPKAVKVVSTHGAGDCFVGSLAARLAAGEHLREAAELANEIAADYVGRPRGA
jgi:ribokinase